MAGHDNHRYPEQHRPPREVHDWQRQAGWRQQGGWQGHPTWHEHRAQNWNNDHRTWSQRGGYGGAFIPQPRFYQSFGREHPFRMRRPTMYMGYPRFQYGGYRFIFVDPWPEYWADSWYEDDDVYVDYGEDGYYLYNRRDPGVAIAVTVVM